MKHSHFRLVPIAMSVLLATSLVSSGAAAASTFATTPGSATDISDSALGRSLAQQAADHYARLGVPRQPLRVWRDARGYVIAPLGTEFAPTSVALPDGTATVSSAPTTSSVRVARMAAPAATTASGSWSLAGQACFSRITDTWTWLDHCYWMWQLANDGDTTRDWYALEHFATMHPNSPWVGNWAKISSSPTSGSAAQTWADWSPRGDYNQSCHTITVGITSPVGGISFSTNQCEVWDMTKGNPAVTYDLAWIGPGVRQDREVGYQISVSVPQGGWPQWSLPAETHGSAY